MCTAKLRRIAETGYVFKQRALYSYKKSLLQVLPDTNGISFQSCMNFSEELYKPDASLVCKPFCKVDRKRGRQCANY